MSENPTLMPLEQGPMAEMRRQSKTPSFPELIMRTQERTSQAISFLSFYLPPSATHLNNRGSGTFRPALINPTTDNAGPMLSICASNSANTSSSCFGENGRLSEPIRGSLSLSLSLLFKGGLGFFFLLKGDYLPLLKVGAAAQNEVI